MASDPNEVKIHRSGALYMLEMAGRGRLVDPDEDWIGEVGDAAAIVAHCNVYHPWVPIPADGPLPEVVATAASSFARDVGASGPLARVIRHLKLRRPGTHDGGDR